jgi:ABC-type multidrug transport system fused ATPase/permease subunit
VERVVEYLDVAQEAPAIIEKSRPPAYWPSSSGELVVDNLVVKYAPDLPPVLRNLSFTIKPSEKVGVVRPAFLWSSEYSTFLGWTYRIRLAS